jgi:hypothetical protein
MSAIHRDRPPTSTITLEDEGVEGNTRLTGATGIVLLFMLAVEGYTILDVRGMITLHIFLGIMLVGPVLLKTATTMYRFTRYYQHKPAYVRRGPPHIVLRVLGPVVIVSSLAVLGTGIGLLGVHSRDGGTLLTAHQASFIVWVFAMTIHVLGHVKEAVVASWAELRHTAPRRLLRLTALVLAIGLGVGGGAVLIGDATQWTHRGSHHFGQRFHH